MLLRRIHKPVPSRRQNRKIRYPAFVDRLTQAFEPGTENAEIRQVSMQEIVDQVVNHIRIRVLPQTTSMELQLNPESLGRVHLSVSSNQGVATATLTVQNEMAKEALESQLVVLRENLESQGLKVESVEVNVSNFGSKTRKIQTIITLIRKKVLPNVFASMPENRHWMGIMFLRKQRQNDRMEKVLWIILHSKKEANTWQHHWMVL